MQSRRPDRSHVGPVSECEWPVGTFCPAASAGYQNRCRGRTISTSMLVAGSWAQVPEVRLTDVASLRSRLRVAGTHPAETCKPQYFCRHERLAKNSPCGGNETGRNDAHTENHTGSRGSVRPDANPQQIPARLQQVASGPVLQTATGGATFYANKFEGRRTASGIPFRQNQMVAAHRSFPFGTILRVTNLRNDRALNVRVVDRGPFGSPANRQRTMIDLSRRAATDLGFVDAGRAQVRVEVLEWGQGVTRAS
ncbi:hypothetical protein BH23GEM6_BH23GEM6_27400 [soil metagenome]